MKLLILDKDGTLVTTKSGETFVQHPQDQKLLPNVAEVLSEYASQGWTMAIASNQGGIESGYKTIDEAIAEMQYCLSMLPMIDCAIFAPYYDARVAWRVWADRERLPDEVYAVTKARKPGTGMLHLAASNCDAIFINAAMVGDRPEDQLCAAAAGVQFQWAKDFFGGAANQ